MTLSQHIRRNAADSAISWRGAAVCPGTRSDELVTAYQRSTTYLSALSTAARGAHQVGGKATGGSPAAGGRHTVSNSSPVSS